MNPLLLAIQEALKPLTSDTPEVKPPQLPKPTALPDSYRQATDAAGVVLHPLLKAVQFGFETIDKVWGVPGRVVGRLEQLRQGASKTEPEVVPQKFTEQLGGAAAGIFGEGARLPVEFGAGFILPPFGIEGFLGTTIKTAKLGDLASFAEKAAVSKNADEIALEAERAFPGIPKETAQGLGRKYEAVTDPAQIIGDLRFPEAVTRERGMFTSAKGAMPETAARMTEQRYIVRPTIPSAQAARNLIRSNPDEAERIARQEFSDQSMFVAEELGKHLDDLAAKAKAAGNILAENQYRDKAADILNIAVRNATEAGRIAQATSMLTKQTPEGIARFTAKQIQRFNETVPPSRRIPELSGAQRKELVDEWNRIQKIEDVDKKAEAISQYFDKLANMIPSSYWKQTATLWKAGLLTGLRTTGLNILSTTANTAGELVKDVPAAIVDSVWSLFSGKRTLALTTRGMASGTKEGFSKGWRYLRTGYSERDVLSKFDVKKVSFGTSPFAKAVQRYEEAIFRWIGAQDMPFYYGAKARSLFSQAIAAGKNLGLRGDNLTTYVNKLVQEPTDDMLKYATLDAEIATFQNSTALAKFGQAIQKLNGGEFIIPFARTPAAVAMQVINYTPAGLVGEIYRSAQRGYVDQRLMSQAIGRAVTGTGALWLGSELFKKGVITLGYPTSESERKQWEIEGKMPNAINIDGTWRSLGAFGPLGLTMIIGGYFAQGIKDEGSPTAAFLQAGAAVGSTLTEQSFLKGTNALVEVLNDPAPNAAGFFSGYLGSIIPTIVSDVARATDTVDRRQEDILSGFKMRTPGLRQTLEPRINTLGQDKPVPNFLTVMLDPTRPSPASKDPVVLEFKRLWDAGFKSTPTQLGNKKGYSSLTPEQNTDLWEMSGQAIYRGMQKAVANPNYQKLTDDKKQKLIAQFTEDAKIQTRAAIILSLTQGLTGDALKAALIKHRESKLLTKDVYAEFLKHRRQIGF